MQRFYMLFFISRFKSRRNEELKSSVLSTFVNMLELQELCTFYFKSIYPLVFFD